MKNRVCELCNEDGHLYCESDSAFLCWKCDARVHEANFLVARHVRLTLCAKCKEFDGKNISGTGIGQVYSICRSCLPESCHKNGDSSSSACISSEESFSSTSKKKLVFNLQHKIASSSSLSEVSGEDSSSLARNCREILVQKKKKNALYTERSLRSLAPAANMNVKAEGILVNWCRKLGLENDYSVSVASHALEVSLRKLTGLPFRLSLASSLWFSLKLNKTRSPSTYPNLKTLELISGVPAKLIVWGESKVSRVRKKSPPDEEEEGWGEISN